MTHPGSIHRDILPPFHNKLHHVANNGRNNVTAGLSSRVLVTNYESWQKAGGGPPIIVPRLGDSTREAHTKTSCTYKLDLSVQRHRGGATGA